MYEIAVVVEDAKTVQAVSDTRRRDILRYSSSSRESILLLFRMAETISELSKNAAAAVAKKLRKAAKDAILKGSIDFGSAFRQYLTASKERCEKIRRISLQLDKIRAGFWKPFIRVLCCAAPFCRAPEATPKN